MTHRCPNCGHSVTAPRRPRVGLTKRQLELFNFIVRHRRDAGVSPSYDEMASAMGLRSKGRVAEMVRALSKRGYVVRNPSEARSVIPSSDVCMPLDLIKAA